MGEIPIYQVTSREHKFQGLKKGLALYGINAGWIQTPPHSPEPDHIRDPDEAARWKLIMFAFGIGREKILKQIPTQIAVWRIVTMDVGGVIEGKKEPTPLTTCRNVHVVAEHINGTAKLLAESPADEKGNRCITWNNSTASLKQGRGLRPQPVITDVQVARLYVNEQLALSMGTECWKSTVKNKQYQSRDKVVNHHSSGGLGWHLLPSVLGEGEEVIWESDGRRWTARGTRVGQPEIEDGMLPIMDAYLRGFVPATLDHISRLT